MSHVRRLAGTRVPEVPEWPEITSLPEKLKREWTQAFMDQMDQYYLGQKNVAEAFNFRKSISNGDEYIAQFSVDTLNAALQEIDTTYHVQLHDEGGIELVCNKAGTYSLYLPHRPLEELVEMGFKLPEIAQLKPSIILIHDAIFHNVQKNISDRIFEEGMDSGVVSEKLATDRKNFLDSLYKVAKIKISEYEANDPSYVQKILDAKHCEQASSVEGISAGNTSSMMAALGARISKVPVKCSASQLEANQSARRGYFDRHPHVKHALIGAVIGVILAVLVTSLVVSCGATTPAVLLGIAATVGAVTTLTGTAATAVGITALVAGVALVSAGVGVTAGAVKDVAMKRLDGVNDNSSAQYVRVVEQDPDEITRPTRKDEAFFDKRYKPVCATESRHDPILTPRAHGRS